MPTSEFDKAWNRLENIDKNRETLASDASSEEAKGQARHEIQRDEKWLGNTRSYWRRIEHNKSFKWRHEVGNAIFQIWGWGELPPIREMAKDPRLVAAIDALPETRTAWKQGYYLNLNGGGVPRGLYEAIREAIEAKPLTPPVPAKPGRKKAGA